MKKILAFALATLMLLSLTACAGNNNANQSSTEAPATSASKTITPNNLKDGSMGTAMWNDFEAYMSENPDATPDEIALALVDAQQNHEIPLSMVSMPVEPGYLTGLFSEENNVETKEFKSGAVFMPMIGSIPFVGYIFELEDGADVNAFIAELEKNANPRWNICVEATETMVGAIDNTVFFVMTPGVYGEDIT